MTDMKLRKLVLAALFAALCTVMTMVIQVPSPMQGYVNLGDCAVLLSAWVLGPWYGGAAAGLGSMLADLLALPELQELNAIATAEGAVALAMREQNTTLFDMRCVVLGYGRCGSALCRRLAALGAKVTAAARRREQLARIYADGHTPCDINKLSPALDGCEVVFNTVPAPVLPEELLRRLPPEALVVELASAPGGCDAAVAEAMGLRYRNAPGLPGKAAPRTAGEYLGQVIRGLPHWEE